MMPFGSSACLIARIDFDRDRMLVAHQLVALEPADAVLGADAAAIARDQIVHGPVDVRRQAQKRFIVAVARAARR